MWGRMVLTLTTVLRMRECPVPARRRQIFILQKPAMFAHARMSCPCQASTDFHSAKTCNVCACANVLSLPSVDRFSFCKTCNVTNTTL
jgi:hypothetical protein